MNYLIGWLQHVIHKLINLLITSRTRNTYSMPLFNRVAHSAGPGKLILGLLQFWMQFARFWVDFGTILVGKLGPSWLQKSIKMESKMTSKKEVENYSYSTLTTATTHVLNYILHVHFTFVPQFMCDSSNHSSLIVVQQCTQLLHSSWGRCFPFLFTHSRLHVI